MTVFCKRCGRVLTSVKSIELGYGPTCYRKEMLQESSIQIEEELKFLKIEIKMLKKTLRELKATTLKVNTIEVNECNTYQASPIVTISREARYPERNTNKGHMKEVIQELKACFQNCDGDVKTLLKPIEIETNLTGTSPLTIA